LWHVHQSFALIVPGLGSADPVAVRMIERETVQPNLQPSSSHISEV